MFELVLNSMIHVSKWNSQLLKPLVSEFLEIATSRTAASSTLWPSFAFTMLAHTAGAAVIARILKYVKPDLLTDSILQISGFILWQMEEGAVSEREGIALITIIFHRFPSAIPSMLTTLFAIRGFTQFKLRAIERAYNKIETRAAIDQIAAFLTDNLDSETLLVVGSVLVKRPRIGVEILKRGVFDECLNRTFEPGSGLTLLHFLNLVFDRLHDFPGINGHIGLAAIRTFAAEGNDRTNGEVMAGLALNLLRKLGTVEEAFRGLSPDAQAEVNRILVKYGSKKVVKKVSLVKFAATSRRKVDEGGWQSLD
jgi:hypothetical protein